MTGFSRPRSKSLHRMLKTTSFKESPMFVALIGLFIFFSTISPLSATEFFSDFNNGLPPNTAVLGTAIVGAEGGTENSGVLKLTGLDMNQVGSFVIGPLDG